MAHGVALEQRAIRPRIRQVGGAAENPWRRQTKAEAKAAGTTRRRIIKAAKRTKRAAR